MRRSDRLVTDTEWIQKVLADSSYMVLSMIDGDVPYAVPLNYVYADGVVYFHCALRGRKLDVLRRNPNVCMTVVRTAHIIASESGVACDMSTAYESVFATGEAFVLKGDEACAVALNLLVVRYGGDGTSVLLEQSRRIALVGIRVTSISGKRAHVL